MSILSAKYKAHKFINYAFYVVVFIIGFLLGFSTEKIDINKLVSQVLMIENVSAYTMPLGTDGITEEDIIEKFNYISNGTFDILKTPYITCISNGGNYSCYATDNKIFDSSYGNWTISSSSLWYRPSSFNSYTGYFCKFTGAVSTGEISNDNIMDCSLEKSISAESPSIPKSTPYSTNRGIWTNYEASDEYIKGTSNLTNTNGFNTLDFSDYEVNLDFNENLFKDNPDFKEVCVNNYDKFGIVSNNYSTIETENVENNYRVFSDRDFIWFPNGVKGISTFLYHNKSENNTKLIEQDGVFSLYGYWFWLNSKEEIDNYFSSDDSIVSYMLNEKGYTDKYSYYNYTMHPFINYFNGLDEEYLFNVFWFKELGINHIDDDNIEYPDKYCFYVRNEYDVLIFKTNEWGDLYVDTTILGDKDLHFSTSENESSVNNVGLFSVVNNFIHQIKSTIEFINMNIYNLYLSMPLIVRSFIISFLVLIIIRILIGMVVR